MVTEGSFFGRMKNKYLTKYLCISMISAMVLSSPMSILAADEGIEASSDFGDGSDLSDGSGEETPAPEPTTAPDPEPTVAPEPTPAPEPTT